ncbi:MAG TPA: Flp family type IVb pilin [Actinomycetota bacterium]|nr:Flp family type IVb pilin [Actinomycetota bacterium]
MASEGGEQVLLGLYVKMQTMWAGVRSRMEDETGAVATEYVVLLVLIALGIIVGAAVLASAINSKFVCASTSISPIATSASC